MPAPRLETHVLAMLAQQFQRWGNLLRQQDEGGETASPQSLPAAGHSSSPAITTASSAQPPAHWVKQLHSHEPPAHWLELVRQKAPGLLDGTGRGVLQARRHTPPAHVRPRPADTRPDFVASPTEAQSGMSHFSQTDAGSEHPAPRPTLTFSVSAAQPSKPSVYPAPDKHYAQPLVIHTPAPTTIARTGNHSQKWVYPSDHSDLLPPPTNDIHQVELPVKHHPSLNDEEISEPAQDRWSESPRSESGTAPGLTTNEVPPSNASVWISDNVSATSAYAFPRYDELSPLESRPTSKVEPPVEPLVPQAAFDDSATLTHSQVRDRHAEAFEGLWPELPTIDASSESDQVTFQRNWKRHERLDREQRGMGWSEPLS